MKPSAPLHHLVGQPDPFPITISGYDHHVWRNWVQAFPFALVADADAKPLKWVNPDDLSPCKNVVVGLHVTEKFKSNQIFSNTPLTPNDVSDHLVRMPTQGEEIVS